MKAVIVNFSVISYFKNIGKIYDMSKWTNSERSKIPWLCLKPGSVIPFQRVQSL